MAVNRRKPKWKKIVPFEGIATKYGFESRTDPGDYATLGQEDINPAADYQGLVIYPNNCQPHEAHRKRTTGSSSGLIAHASIQAAQTAGWRIKWGYPPRQRRAKGQNKHNKVTLNGIDYAWIRPLDPLYSLLANHGHKTPSAGEVLWYGCQFPRPSVVGVEQTSSGSTASSFCDPQRENNVINTGGFIVEQGAYTATHLANMLVSASSGANP